MIAQEMENSAPSEQHNELPQMPLPPPRPPPPRSSIHSPAIGPHSPPTGRTTMSGYLHRIEIRAIGLVARRRYWFALSDSSQYLYWFKEREDVRCCGRVSLAGAAITYNPREKGRFEIHAGAEVLVLECSSDRMRNEWMKALQDARKRCHQHHEDEKIKEIVSLSRDVLSQEDSSCSSSESEENSIGDGDHTLEAASRTPSALELMNDLLGPRGLSDDSRPSTLQGDAVNFSSNEADVVMPSPSSTFYLNTEGQLNEFSMQMPPETFNYGEVIQRLAERTEAGLKAPKSALDRAKRGLMNLKDRQCSQCKERSAYCDALEEQVTELEEHKATMNEVINVLKVGLLTTQRQLETLQAVESLQGDAALRHFLLEKEKRMTKFQVENNQLHRKLQELETENRELDGRCLELQSSVEAFRDSVRTKEELIMKMCEQGEQISTPPVSAVSASGIIGDVEVPEGILIDCESLCDDAAQAVFDATQVQDVNEMKDLVEGYKAQNSFLNLEIVELHAIIQSLEARERQLCRKNFDVEACYYQLKSRYLMVLNHFKSPDQPSKIMEAGVLRELLEEAGRTPQKEPKTDRLGFYLRDESDKSDLVDAAAEYMEKSKEIVRVTQLEQSEECMQWLQAWDALLVNFANKPLNPSPELKELVRKGVPEKYRNRVWKSLVAVQVRSQQAELGNGYYKSMLRKASALKEQGTYDAAIKQIDLDLGRTLPTNRHFDYQESEKIEQLRNVLYAFRYHNNDVGYCQGLNRLAAVALIFLTEEEAFWFVVAYVEHLQPEGYYTSTLIGAVADQKVLRDLVAEKIPRLAAHLRLLEVDLSLFALSWFLTCFVDVLPHSIYFNIFDVFLYEGNKVLFRFALAILKQCEAAVLNCRTIGTVHMCLSRAAEHVKDFKSLSQVAFYELNPFPQKLIETKRALYLAQLKDQGYH